MTNVVYLDQTRTTLWPCPKFFKNFNKELGDDLRNTDVWHSQSSWGTFELLDESIFIGGVVDSIK